MFCSTEGHSRAEEDDEDEEEEEQWVTRPEQLADRVRLCMAGQQILANLSNRQKAAGPGRHLMKEGEDEMNGSVSLQAHGENMWRAGRVDKIR